MNRQICVLKVGARGWDKGERWGQVSLSDDERFVYLDTLSAADSKN